jgi:hypothetical protein
MLDEKLVIEQTLRDDDLHLWEHIGTGDRLVVCFSPTGTENPDEPQDISFPAAATNHGENHVLFVSDPQRTWLNEPGLREKIFFHVEKFKTKVQPTSVVTLGHSMGGFYALACAADIGASVAVALAPQVSIHPEIAGDDKRWQNFRNRIPHYRYRHVSELLTEIPQYFIVHGGLDREKPQRDRAPVAKNIAHFILPDIHHNVPATLKRTQLQETFINTCFNGDQKAALKILKPLDAYKRTLKLHPKLAPVRKPGPVFKPIKPMFDTRSVSYFFVMDGARFEAAAILLAQSLRDSLGLVPEIIAYAPKKSIAEIQRITRRMLELLNVEIRAFESTQVDWNPAYPHGNKILASCERRSTDLSVFLDTDVVCMGEMDFGRVTSDTPLFAVPEGVPTWGGRTDEMWRPVYDMFDMGIPDLRVKLVKGRGRIVLPYFNAGVVGFVERGNAAGQRLPDMWLDTAIAIDGNPVIENKRPWLDQIALPVAAARMGGDIEVMSNVYNFSTYRLRGGEDISHVKLLHYRMAAHYRKYEECRRITERVLEGCPDRIRPRMREKLGLFLRGIQLPNHLAAQ